MAERIRTVRLYGKLGARFGRVHHLAVNSAAEAVRALGVLHKGFTQFLAEAKDMGLAFVIFYGKRNLAQEQLGDPPSSNDIRIAPVVTGRKSGGLQVVLGIALIAVATIATAGVAGLASASAWAAAIGGTGWGVVGSIGLSLALGGVASLIAGTPQGLSSSESTSNTPSYNFSGIKNTTAQGGPVPLCYGEMTVGSAMISLGIRAEDQQ
ncbi:tail assembly protein [Pseudomonas urethralis]|uniref:tail assembly protein n=1 Tax=Pseudomonas urethralis TaxID=2740517 RepID=UPI0015968423|nr:tail assembly protein [Pseudomonas urethralis]